MLSKKTMKTSVFLLTLVMLLSLSISGFATYTTDEVEELEIESSMVQNTFYIPGPGTSAYCYITQVQTWIAGETSTWEIKNPHVMTGPNPRRECTNSLWYNPWYTWYCTYNY